MVLVEWKGEVESLRRVEQKLKSLVFGALDLRNGVVIDFKEILRMQVRQSKKSCTVITSGKIPTYYFAMMIPPIRGRGN
jgi:hypothetical protein